MNTWSCCQCLCQAKTKNPEYYKIMNNLLDSYLAKDLKISYIKDFIPPRLSLNTWELILTIMSSLQVSAIYHTTRHQFLKYRTTGLRQLYNLPIDEFMEVINYALKAGYCIAWTEISAKRDFLIKMELQ